MLFSTSPGVGHLLPLLPLARAAREHDHEVVVAAGASLSAIIVAAGLRHEPIGPGSIDEVARTLPELAGLTGRDRAVVMLRECFCGAVASAMAGEIPRLARRWRPDVIVHEDVELGSWVVAEQLGIPHLTVQATAWRPRLRKLAGRWLEPLRDRFGLEGVIEDERLAGQLFLTTRPAALRDPSAPFPEATAELRPIADDRHHPGVGAEPFRSRDGRPRVAVTLGTVNQHQVAVLRALMKVPRRPARTSSSR